MIKVEKEIEALEAGIIKLKIESGLWLTHSQNENILILRV